MIKLDNIKILVGDNRVYNQIKLPFEKSTIDFINELSKKLMIINYK